MAGFSRLVNKIKGGSSNNNSSNNLANQNGYNNYPPQNGYPQNGYPQNGYPSPNGGQNGWGYSGDGRPPPQHFNSNSSFDWRSNDSSRASIAPTVASNGSGGTNFTGTTYYSQPGPPPPQQPPQGQQFRPQPQGQQQQRGPAAPPPQPNGGAAAAAAAGKPDVAVTAEDVRACTKLLRRRYELQLEIWALRHAHASDQNVRFEKQRQADAMLVEIQNMIATWEHTSGARWTDEERMQVNYIARHLDSMPANRTY